MTDIVMDNDVGEAGSADEKRRAIAIATLSLAAFFLDRRLGDESHEMGSDGKLTKIEGGLLASLFFDDAPAGSDASSERNADRNRVSDTTRTVAGRPPSNAATFGKEDIRGKDEREFFEAMRQGETVGTDVLRNIQKVLNGMKN